MKHHTKTAKYQVIYDALYNRLQEGIYPVGVRLPSEKILAEDFKVNRLTLRHALKMLCQDGYLTVRQGSGYAVKAISPINCLNSFTDTVLQQGFIPKTRLLSIQIPCEHPNTFIRELFKQPVCSIRRLRLIDDIPWLLTKTYVPMSFVSDISYLDFPETGIEQSILNILHKRFSLSWVKACETITPQIADRETAQLLDVSENTPLILQRCVAYDENEMPVFCDYALRAKPINYDLIGTERILREG